MTVSSVFELWVDYPLSTEGVRVAQADTAEELVKRAKAFLEEGLITHWYVMERRTTVSFHIVAVMVG